MSHFTVLVIGDDVEAQLEPYNENKPVRADVTDERTKEWETEKDFSGKPFKTEYATAAAFAEEWHGDDVEDGRIFSTRNPQAKWDWWTVGGRWTGYFKLKPGAKGKLGKSGVFDNTAEPGWADVVRVRDVDFEGMMEHEAQEAAKRFDKLESYIGKITPLKHTWAWLVSAEPNDIPKMRELYWNQPQLLAVKAAAWKLPSNHPDASFLTFLRYEDFTVGRDAYIALARKSAISTFAVVKDGKWFEKGTMGWWAVVHNEKDEEKWLEEFNKLVRGLPPETMLTVVDCHI
jgi:hypothetical protein